MVAIVQRLEHRLVVPMMRVRFPLATPFYKEELERLFFVLFIRLKGVCQPKLTSFYLTLIFVIIVFNKSALFSWFAIL